MINLWSKDRVTVGQLLGDDQQAEMINDLEGLREEEMRRRLERDQRVMADTAGWDDVPEMPDALEQEEPTCLE